MVLSYIFQQTILKVEHLFSIFGIFKNIVWFTQVYLLTHSVTMPYIFPVPDLACLPFLRGVSTPGKWLLNTLFPVFAVSMGAPIMAMNHLVQHTCRKKIRRKEQVEEEFVPLVNSDVREVTVYGTTNKFIPLRDRVLGYILFGNYVIAFIVLLSAGAGLSCSTLDGYSFLTFYPSIPCNTNNKEYQFMFITSLLVSNLLGGVVVLFYAVLLILYRKNLGSTSVTNTMGFLFVVSFYSLSHIFRSNE